MAVQAPRSLSTADGSFNVEAWTEQAVLALRTANSSGNATIPPRPVRGMAVALEIPLDAHAAEVCERHKIAQSRDAAPELTRHREPMRRDSLKRREALLRGKEGSRRRLRWENDRLLGNPWAQPPMPHDWEIHPTYPVHSVPYFLAPLWDERQADKTLHCSDKADKGASTRVGSAAKVPKELRQKLKRSKGAKGLLQDLEEEVRKFLVTWEERGRQLEKEGLANADSSEDEEIVFVGRNGALRNVKKEDEELGRDKLIFDSLVDDHGASFGRWLVHSIAIYYDLHTWSVTTGNPARREAYVGIPDARYNKANRFPSPELQLPRPLWVMV